MSVTKAEFPHLFLKAFNQITQTTVQSGFKATGIYPWDFSAIDFSKCLSKRNVSCSIEGGSENLTSASEKTYRREEVKKT